LKILLENIEKEYNQEQNELVMEVFQELFMQEKI
jgi:hypothetical protein